jgi:F0F1-type ATP synthase delta subunit
MARKFVLPTLVVGPADVKRLAMEMESLDEYLRQAFLRPGAADVKLPKTSRTLDSLAELNEADLLQAEDREQLKAFLSSLQSHAPVIHISFAAEPSAAFTGKIVEWMRANIAHYLLVQVGLQPSIAAGCVVRTTNRIFDLSLRQYLLEKRDILAESLHTMKDVSHDAVPAASAAVPEAVPLPADDAAGSAAA